MKDMKELLLRHRPNFILLAVAAVTVAAASARGSDAPPLPDTELLVTVHWSQLRGSPLVQAEKEVLGQFRSAADRLTDDHPVLKWLKRGGLDLVNDIESVSFALPRGKDLDAGVLVLRGKFDLPKLHDAAKQLSGVKVTGLKRTSQKLELAVEGRMPCAVAVDGSTLIAARDRRGLTAALARADAATKTEQSPAVAELVKTIKPSDSISLVASGPALASLLNRSSFGNAEVAANALQALDGLAASLTLADDVRLQLTVYARDAAAAAKLTEASNVSLRTAQTLARERAKDDARLRPLDDIVSTLRITSDGPCIVFRAHATLDTIERLMKGLGRAAP